jgi:Domain of unknown function (DUF4760)
MLNLNVDQLTLLVLVFTALIMIYQIKLDHDRRRKESTIDHINEIRPQYRKLDHELVKRLGVGPIDDKKIKKIVDDNEFDELHEEIKEMLGMFEHLAVGVNADVFDIGLLNRMSGSFLIRVHDRWSLYFENRRSKSGNSKLYEEFDTLVTKIKALRR